MTAGPRSIDPWQVTVTDPWLALEPLPAVDVRRELRGFAVTTVLIALTGAVAGLVWAHLAPTLDRGTLAQLLAGAEEPFRVQIGADAWFALVTATAGVMCAAVALAARGDGPGVLGGLAVGGMAAALIADRVGYLAQRSATLHALKALGLNAHDVDLSIIDFRVRAVGVLVAWPLAAVLVHACALALRRRDRQLP